jgi:hypothetical protein
MPAGPLAVETVTGSVPDGLDVFLLRHNGGRVLVLADSRGAALFLPVHQGES